MDPTHARGPRSTATTATATAPAPAARQSRDPSPTSDSTRRSRPARCSSSPGDFLLTVNPVDGSEVEPCPPGERPAAPVRRTAAERADRSAPRAPPVPPGPRRPAAAPAGTPGGARAAGAAAGPRPLRASHRTGRLRPHRAARRRRRRLRRPRARRRRPPLRPPAHRRRPAARPLRRRLRRARCTAPTATSCSTSVRDIGAVVVVDDLEFGGAAARRAAGRHPRVRLPLRRHTRRRRPLRRLRTSRRSSSPGLGRAASLELLAQVVERAAHRGRGELGGRPLVRVRGAAAALRPGRAPCCASATCCAPDPARLRRVRLLRGTPGDAPPTPRATTADGHDVPLPSLGEGAAPAALLASRLSEAARDTLRFAVALGGEVPHQAHLPALVGDTHADAALGELARCGLLSPAGPRYRLAAGVLAQLEAAGYADDAAAHARTAAQHYAWWAGHPSVTPERAVAEADAILAAMRRLVPDDGAGTGQRGRAAGPQRRSRASRRGCTGAPGRRRCGPARRPPGSPVRSPKRRTSTTSWASSRSAPATSTGPVRSWRPPSAMRGALADKSGAVAGRRALALVADRSGGLAPPVRPPGGRRGARPHVEDRPPRRAPSDGLPGRAAFTADSRSGRLPARAGPVPAADRSRAAGARSWAAPGATWSPRARARCWSPCSAPSSPSASPSGRPRGARRHERHHRAVVPRATAPTTAAPDAGRRPRRRRRATRRGTSRPSTPGPDGTPSTAGSPSPAPGPRAAGRRARRTEEPASRRRAAARRVRPPRPRRPPSRALADADRAPSPSATPTESEPGADHADREPSDQQPASGPAPVRTPPPPPAARTESATARRHGHAPTPRPERRPHRGSGLTHGSRAPRAGRRRGRPVRTGAACRPRCRASRRSRGPGSRCPGRSRARAPAA